MSAYRSSLVKPIPVDRKDLGTTGVQFGDSVAEISPKGSRERLHPRRIQSSQVGRKLISIADAENSLVFAPLIVMGGRP